MTQLLAYPHNDKAMYLARVRAHREADELVRGTGWESNGHVRGCAVGCSIHCYDHSKYPELLGVPEQLAYLEDWLFENLPADHLSWPERFLAAIPEGADLSNVLPQWCVRMLNRRLAALPDVKEPWLEQVRTAITQVRDLYVDGMPSARAASAAAWAASAASAAAWAARAASDAAWAAARAASAAARAASAAAWAASAAARAASAASDAARAAEITQQANDLLELLAAAGKEGAK